MHLVKQSRLSALPGNRISSPDRADDRSFFLTVYFFPLAFTDQHFRGLFYCRQFRRDAEPKRRSHLWKRRKKGAKTVKQNRNLDTLVPILRPAGGKGGLKQSRKSTVSLANPEILCLKEG